MKVSYTALDKCCRDTSMNSKWRADGRNSSLALLNILAALIVHGEKGRSNASGGLRIQIYKQSGNPLRIEL